MSDEMRRVVAERQSVDVYRNAELYPKPGLDNTVYAGLVLSLLITFLFFWAPLATLVWILVR